MQSSLYIYIHRRYIPAGKPAMQKRVRIFPPLQQQQQPANTAAAFAEPAEKKRRTLREILGGFMEIPFHVVVSGKMR